jgi:hypothetical protein
MSSPQRVDKLRLGSSSGRGRNKQGIAPWLLREKEEYDECEFKRGVSS